MDVKTDRSLLHLVRGERDRVPFDPEPDDRVVHLEQIEPDELVALIFQYDGVVVW
jgi:hypothetical protein